MADSSDPYELVRFVEAQERGGAYADAIAELRRGRKQSHWMWFVFPQVRGLGSSWMAQRYGIASLGEARAYLTHPVLGPRLLECVQAMLATDARSADSVLGGIDSIKLKSSMTLFREADPEIPGFQRVLDRFFNGAADQATLERL